VHLDGAATRACIVPVAVAEGKKIGRVSCSIASSQSCLAGSMLKTLGSAAHRGRGGCEDVQDWTTL
jgi:hypothetical protein